MSRIRKIVSGLTLTGAGGTAAEHAGVPRRFLGAGVSSEYMILQFAVVLGLARTLILCAVYGLLGVLLSIYRHRNLVWETPALKAGEKMTARRITGRTIKSLQMGNYVIYVEKVEDSPIHGADSAGGI